MRNVNVLGSLLIAGMLGACASEPSTPSGTSATTGASQPTAGSPTPASAPTAAAGSPSTAAAGSKSIATTPAANAGSPAPASTGAAGSAAQQPGELPTTPSDMPPTASAADSGTWCGVKRTLDAHCVACHNEQKVAGAPMSLKTYADTQAPAVSDPTKKVYQLVGVRVHDTKAPMPPQDKLTTEQLAGIDTWVAASAPAGADPTCAANGPTDATATDDGWQWPTNCDATYKLLSHGPSGDTAPYSVPAGQEIHPQIALTAPWGNEEVQMIAWRAITDNPKVLHHWILYGSQREHLVGWAPGKEHNTPLPEDVGLELPGGSFTLDMHYNNLQGTSEQQDNSGVEVCLLKKEHFRAKTAGVYTRFATFAISIPPHATNHDVTATCNVSMSQPVTLLTASPHAHTYATHMKFTVQRASGETLLMHEGAFSFDEQGSYQLKTPVDLKEGDKVITTCTYDNTSDQTVTFGENTGNEMCFNFAVYYPIGALNCGGFAGGGFPMF